MMTDRTEMAAPRGLAKRLPTEEEIENAAHAATAIANAMDVDGGLKVPGQDGDPVRISPALGDLIVELLGHVASGSMVTIAPHDAMLTTTEAANLLNVSRPHLTKLLTSGEIPFDMVGRHRRVRLAHLMSYRDVRQAARSSALDDLARLGQEFEAG